MKILKEILDWTGCIFLSVFIALIIIIFIAQPTHVEGKSMEPTLYDNDRILINKLPHTLKTDIKYGDIVIIDSRVNRKRTFKDDVIDTLKYNLISYKILNINQEHIFWVKRVIGKSGDQIEYKDKKLYRNNKLVEEPYIKEKMEYFPEEKVIVPNGFIFVMGDNRNNSSDSRFIGCIPIDHIIGKYILKF